MRHLLFRITFGLFGCKKNQESAKNRNSNSVLRLVEVLKQYPECKIFKVLNSENEVLNWIIEPTLLEIIPSNDEDGDYIIQALLISQDKSEESCYMNMITPERISDYVIYDLQSPKVTAPHNLKNKDVIPNMASDCFGQYELYYSEINPEKGINILRQGLIRSKEKSVIAGDLGYILRDEKRYEEALEAFLISEENEPSPEYTYAEISDLYKELGDLENSKKYLRKFEPYEIKMDLE